MLLLRLNHRLLMVTLIICDCVDIVVHEALSLKEVLPSLLLLYLLLTLVQSLSLLSALKLHKKTFLKLFQKANQLHSE